MRNSLSFHLSEFKVKDALEKLVVLVSWRKLFFFFFC